MPYHNISLHKSKGAIYISPLLHFYTFFFGIEEFIIEYGPLILHGFFSAKFPVSSHWEDCMSKYSQLITCPWTCAFKDLEIRLRPTHLGSNSAATI